MTTPLQLLPARSPWFTAPADARRTVSELTADARRAATDRAETVSAYAALHTGALGIHAPHRHWHGHPDGTAHYADGDGLALVFDAVLAAAGGPAVTAIVPAGCGTDHAVLLTGPAGLALARTAAAGCTGHPVADTPTTVLTLAAAFPPPAPPVPVPPLPPYPPTAGRAPESAAACWCPKGGDPYQCPAAEDDRCEYQTGQPAAGR
ncbi:hypothetical protein ABTX81_30355 [Kitasatospora sp. NPDC097605]|uniref:hypothetical protein n=1 Tax=Kitasatospora sp. NPDC097605 TaxID=3157226 RepID=UPI00332B219C